ncbi:hypothetical protein P879_02302 [Paragonimus westermani]|uniref:Uncharacterized protein n=1 Tax=Paragonimus westermani TaxID=34504 RepID=A0A8T0DHA0_9TREM|nr:hypothetical protein P879_02302 [Paragonimus westermani]
MSGTVVNVTAATNLIAATVNTTKSDVISPTCIGLILNIVIPMVSVIVFVCSVIIAYFVDDPGLRKLKRSTEQPEAMNTDITEEDRNYIRYLADRKLLNHVKGHTFSSFSPGYNHPISAGIDAPELKHPLANLRRRACSESNTGPHISEVSSETQFILEHMLLPLGTGSSHGSIRMRPSFPLPFVNRLKRSDKGYENETTSQNNEEIQKRLEE